MIETLVALALTGGLADGADLACRFPTPANLDTRQVRLELACSLPVYLNGSTLAGGTRPRVVSDVLAGRGNNTLTMKASCAPAMLLVTPRVYISRILPEGNALSVTVENALENTVSVSLSCRGLAGRSTGTARFGTRLTAQE